MKYKIILITIIALSCGFAAHFSSNSKYKPLKIDSNQEYQVANVLDGDTFEVKMGKKIQTVRMIGVDTPETVDPRKPVQCFGKEASQKTKSMLSHHIVRLHTDTTKSITDKFGRLLAYVYLENGLFMNEFLLKEGYAREYTYGKAYSLQKEFRTLEMVAKQGKVGLWKKCE